MSIRNKQIMISSSLALLTILILALTLNITIAHDTGSCTSHIHHNDVHPQTHTHTHQCDHGHHHHHDHHHDIRRKLPEELAEEEDLKLGFDSYYYDHDDPDIQLLTGLGLWVNAMGCSLLVSLASLICLIILPLIFVQGKPSKTIVDALAVFGAGAMLGDAFLHQLPHAFGGDNSHSHDHELDHGHNVHSENGHSHSHSHSIEDLSVGLSILAGIFLFLLVEKAVRYVDDMCGETNAQSHGHHHHHHKSSKKLKDDTDAVDDLQVSSVIKKGGSISNVSPEGTNEDKITDDCSNGELQSGTAVLRKRNITTGGVEEQSKVDDLKDINNNAESTDDQKVGESPSNLVFGYLNLFSDGVHNFTDGMALGSAFLLYGSVGGWSRTLFLLAHELPQEIGDFGILVRSGFSVSAALSFNFLSALAALAGTALVSTSYLLRVELFSLPYHTKGNNNYGVGGRCPFVFAFLNCLYDGKTEESLST
ncbi:hypothetical protein AgCh_032800 [Apium graveolens]